ncbi:MAG: TOBE domain-containing protein [Halobacteria archaeon]|nr:TOBE domain-containing protein [Halobacteria archaeon]
MKPDFEARLEQDGVSFDSRDAELLRAVDEHGSLNKAAKSLGRSYAHAHRRIQELEKKFDSLVSRRRGGSGGGGSELTQEGRELLERFDRLRTEFENLTEVDETVFSGNVVDRRGELATVETQAGEVRALVPQGAKDVEVSVRSDAVTLNSPEDAPKEDATSARNRFKGVVRRIEDGETVARVVVDISGGIELTTLVTKTSVSKLGLTPGKEVIASFKATATRVIS